MFKNHPKGLLGAALANMGERFGFYIMMGILVLFLQTKFNLTDTDAGIIYSAFYAGIYVLALAGGIIADKTKKYKTTILAGVILMSVGYGLLAIPTATPVPHESYSLMLILTCLALFVIAFGNGLFKGNLQALVGQMYDNEKYVKFRDTGFQIFYMFINVGGIFAPLMAIIMRNWWVESNGYLYNQLLPDFCNKYIFSNGATGGDSIVAAAAEMGHTISTPAEIMQFANDYLSVFSTGFNYAFASAIGAMLISIVIFIVNKNKFPDPSQKKAASASANEVQMSAAEIKQRIYALLAVFAVVIFFWFSFHQNGLTLTFFAKDYIDMTGFEVDLGFTTMKGVELFQSFNPLFVVMLTPIIISIFGWLKARNIEPSTPKKIAIGMGIAAIGFVVMVAGSTALPSPAEIAEGAAYSPSVTPWLLIGCYFILTVAELFISPLGISFVSKVAPPHLQGLMQGMWLTATALGNGLLFIGAIFYESISLSMTWTIFVVACLISMVTMLGMLKWLERVSK